MVSRFQRTDSVKVPSEPAGRIRITSSGLNDAILGLKNRTTVAPARRRRDGKIGSAFTATTRVAPISAAAHNGSGFSSPPSAYHRRSMRTGGNPTGMAQEAVKCCQVMAGDEIRRAERRTRSVITTPHGTRGVNEE